MDELAAAIAATTGSARAFAALLGVDERTVRRWQAGDREIPPPVVKLCAILTRHPELAGEL